MQRTSTALLLPIVALFVACAPKAAPVPSDAGADASPLRAIPSTTLSAASAPAPKAHAKEPATAPHDDGIVYCDTSGPPKAPSPDNRVYAVWQSFPVRLDEHATGTLRVLEDSRVTRPGAGRDGTNPAVPPCDLLETRLELLDAHGATVQTERLWPEVDVVLHDFGEGATLIETHEHVLCLASCWCGDTHGYWRIDHGRLAYLRSRVVQRIPAAGSPGVGSSLEIRPVTHGCYEGSHFEQDGGRPVLVVERTAMGSTVTATQRTWFEAGEWRTSIVERK